MATATFNGGVDYYGAESATTNKVKVKSSAENRASQMASGANSFGDIVVCDDYGATAAPSEECEVTGEIKDTDFTDFGGKLISAANGFTQPLIAGGLSFSTSNGAAPTISISGTMVQTGATRLRKYSPVPFTIKPRHRAQNCVCTKSTGATPVYTPIISVNKGQTAASESTDYGWESVSGDIMPLEVTTSAPKGVLAGYDIHAGMANISYSLNWYASTAPTIALTATAVTAGWKLSAIVTKSDPENGYAQYTFSASLGITGTEA